MKRKMEATYGKTLKGVMFAINPLKKKMLKTNCTVHKYINVQALEILRAENHKEAYTFLREHMRELNLGVAWADQDFKSSNHFYHYEKGKGLYGFSDAYTEGCKYYKKAVNYLKTHELEKAMFFFGAACHLVQDVTVPQHVNNKLLKSHRKFELWIIAKLLTDYSFVADKGIIRCKDYKTYIDINARMANDTHNKYKDIIVEEERYRKTAEDILKQAQRTTAGLMLDVYDIIKSNAEAKIECANG